MNNEKMGQFIAELRKAGHMTQKDLAAQLNITDKAVSKWERGLSCPDVSLFPKLARALGVTTAELLEGEKNDSSAGEKSVEASIDNAFQYAGKAAQSRAKKVQNICAAAYSLLLFLGILICAICDMAMTNAFTWSLIPICSIVFAWVVGFPAIKFGGKGIPASLAAITVCVAPFLFALNSLIETDGLLLPIGIRMAVIAVVLLWMLFTLFQVMKKRKLLAGGISLLLVIPVSLIINAVLNPIIREPLLDVWDLLSFSLVAAAAIVLFCFDFAAQKRRKNRQAVR